MDWSRMFTDTESLENLPEKTKTQLSHCIQLKQQSDAILAKLARRYGALMILCPLLHHLENLAFKGFDTADELEEFRVVHAKAPSGKYFE